MKDLEREGTWLTLVFLNVDKGGSITWACSVDTSLPGLVQFSSVQLLSRVRLFVTPWTASLPVHHQFLELTQIPVHQVDDAIQASHPLSSPSPTFNLSQHQGLFQ